MNKEIFNILLEGYNSVAFTDKYIFGFISKDVVYMAFAYSEIIPYITTLDKAGRDGGYALRYKPNKRQIEGLYNSATEVIALCSKDYFEKSVKRSRYNRGEVFERIVFKYFGKRWKKDHKPFYKYGDIKIDGIPYQIKFIGATLTTEKQINGLRF